MIEYLTQKEESLVNMSMFGRNIGDLLKDGINAKLLTLPENNRVKLQNILKSMTNRGKNILIAFSYHHNQNMQPFPRPPVIFHLLPQELKGAQFPLWKDNYFF